MASIRETAAEVLVSDLKVYWFGYGGHSHMAEDLRPVIEELGMTLTTIHEWDNADVRWSLQTWKSELAKADIVIAPANYEEQPAKSSNRLVQSFSMGKPVICSPLDSYVRIEKKYPGCCLFAKSPHDWKKQLKKLRDDEPFRMSVIEKALEASKEYTLDSIGARWEGALGRRGKSFDIVIPTYNNPECLRLCLDSIRECTIASYQIIVVNNGTNPEVDEYLSRLDDIKHIKTGRLNFAQAINKGIRAGDGDYVCLLNDDTIVSKRWLTKAGFALSMDDSIGALGVFSNCDKGWLHNHDVNVGGVDLLPGTNTPEQIKPIVPQLYEGVKNPIQGDLLEQEWVAFYCTTIPRKVIDEVGYLDERFVNSGEDVDYCRRIRKKGYRILQCYDSFVFHFGAVGRKILESEDSGSYHESDRKTQVYLKEKWDKENVVIYTGPSWERWDFRNVNQGGIGGSETWAVCLAREFDKLGYRVKVFADCAESGLKDGEIEYLHFSKYPSYIEQNWIDYFISSRTTDTFDFPVRCGKAYVMIHDIWLLSDRYKIPLDRVDKYCVLSEWHKDFAKGHHKIPEEKLWITANGIDFDRFDRAGGIRDKHRLIYSSSPDRGLETLLGMLPRIREQVPDAHLEVLYGFDNWKKSAARKRDQGQLDRIAKLEEALKAPGVHYHGRVGQDDLAHFFMESGIWAYPTDFEETFSITAIEAQRAHLPVLSTNYAGLKTTVGDSGILLGNGQKGQAFTAEYQKEFVDTCVRLMTDHDFWQEWSDKGYRNTEKYSWENVAKGWQEQFRS